MDPGGPSIPFNELCHRLIKEPYNLRMADIANMTQYQLVNIYCRAPRKEALKWDVSGKTKQKSDEDFKIVYFEIWRKKGMTEEQIQEKWDKDHAPG